MKSKPYLHRAKYYETDQMAIVHHSNYIRWFEDARIEWMEQAGIPHVYQSAYDLTCTCLKKLLNTGEA